ncbi:MAG: 3-hydroxy-3-methylglutaryl CoA synthase, partial [Deltaproteobacteria bacterium]|nr:3-hydroxy-3-methylglutaryl CoA synthase [Deltaproteobacteria bacterium]
MANYDEDSLTMAVAAARDCIKGIAVEDIGGLYFASTTPPYKEKQSAATIATVLGLGREAFTADFSGSLRSGTSAVRAAMDAIRSGSVKNVLVCASDVRMGHPMGGSELDFGDGAAAFLIGDTDVIAEIEGSYSIHDEIQDVWRSDKDTFIRKGENRFILQQGYDRVVREAVSGALERFKLTPEDYAR